MTEPSSPAAEIIDYLRTWSDALTQVLGQITGKPVRFESCMTPEGENPPAVETDLWIVAACDGSLRGEMSLRLARAHAQSLAQLFTGETLDATTEYKTESTEAVLEFMRQVAGQISTVLRPSRGEVQLRLQSGDRPSWPAAATACLATAADAPSVLRIEVQISAALAAALRPAATDPRQRVEVFDASSSKLDKLMDVELAVSLRFGERRMLLGEIMDLSPGVVVELDRKLKEP